MEIESIERWVYGFEGGIWGGLGEVAFGQGAGFSLRAGE